MSTTWVRSLESDPLQGLRAAQDVALVYWVERDLLDLDPGPVQRLWDLPEVRSILRKQQADGSWKYPGKTEAFNNYALLETFRNLRFLVSKYGLDRSQPALEAAAEYVLSCQTAEGDLRGILGNQYIPYYHGAILELLIEAGFGDDPRVRKGLDWLLTMRQADGGWIVPVQAVPARDKTERLWRAAPVPPDRSRPFSHLATGMVLRALARHEEYRGRAEVLAAANLLKGRLLRSDAYNDRRAPLYWTKFQYPFWWTDLVSALDSLFRVGFSHLDNDIQRAIQWFQLNQQADGLWPAGYGIGKKAAQARLWVGLAACRVLRRYLEQSPGREVATMQE